MSRVGGATTPRKTAIFLRWKYIMVNSYVGQPIRSACAVVLQGNYIMKVKMYTTDPSIVGSRGWQQSFGLVIDLNIYIV